MQGELKILPERHVSENAAELWSAERVWLDGRARSPEALALVDAAFEKVRELDERKRSGPKRLQQIRRGVEAFLSVLLLAQASNKSPYVQLPTGAGAFTGEEVSWRTFDRIRTVFAGLEFVKIHPGFKAQFERGRGAYTRFSATKRLLEFSLKYGVVPHEAAWHFKPGLPREPVVLKASKFTEYKDDTPTIVIPEYLKDSASGIREDVRALNVFLDKQEIANCIHNGYVRVFNCGDRPDFNWNLGGRLYSQGAGNYQQRPKVERLKISINGDAVCELDLRASYLTLFLALHGQQLPLSSDPYAAGGLSGFSRHAVKRWFTVSWGQGRLIKKWSEDTVAEEREKSGTDLMRISAGEVAEAALASYPLLAGVAADENSAPLWARLMFKESEVIVGAMLDLMVMGIPSLSMWDGLIVPRGQLGTAQQKLLERFRIVTGGFETSLSISP